MLAMESAPVAYKINTKLEQVCGEVMEIDSLSKRAGIGDHSVFF